MKMYVPKDQSMSCIRKFNGVTAYFGYSPVNKGENGQNAD